MQLGAKAQLDGHGFGQPGNAVFAHHFALDVVAIMAVHEDLGVDDHALGGLQRHDLRIAQLGMGARAGPREGHTGLDIVIVQKPAEHVNLVDQRIMDRHGRRIGLRHGRVAMGGVDHDRRAGLGLHRLFQRDIARIVAAHEAHLHQTFAMGNLGIDDALGAFGRGGQRFFAKARLSCGNRGQHILLVRGAPRGDEHRIDVCGGDQFLARRIDGGVGGDVGLHGLGRGTVHVAQCDDLAASQHLIDAARMVATDGTRSDDSDSDGHGCFLTSRICRCSVAFRRA